MSVQYIAPTTLRIDFTDDTWLTSFPEIFSVENTSPIPWLVSDTFLYEEQNTLRSGAIGHSSTTDITFTFTLAEAGSVTVPYCVGSRTSDYLYIIVDGSTKVSQYGTVQWTMYTQQLSAGTHTLTLMYSKNSSGTTSPDAGAVAYIELVGVTPNFNTYYLVHDRTTDKYYANVEGSLTEVPISAEPTLQNFVDFGGLLPTVGMLTTLSSFRILKCADSTDALGFTKAIKFTTRCNVEAKLLKYKTPVRITEPYQAGFKSVSFVMTKLDSTVVRVLLSHDGEVWQRYTAPATQESTSENGVWSQVDFTADAALVSGMTFEELARVDSDAFSLLYTDGVDKTLYIAFVIKCTELDDWCLSSIRVEFTNTLE